MKEKKKQQIQQHKLTCGMDTVYTFSCHVIVVLLWSAGEQVDSLSFGIFEQFLFTVRNIFFS